MSETPTTPATTPGPWSDPPTAQARAPAPTVATAAEPSLLWNVISTLLLAAWLAWQIGPLGAVAAVLGVFVHEFGHLLVINAAGSGPSHIRIIPFLGGAATTARPPDTEFKGIVIALAGPVFGLLATLPFFGLAALAGEKAWNVGALVVAGFNLLNLAPAPPLDGSKALGPVLARIHPQLERLALVVIGGLAVLWTLSRGSLIAPAFIGLSVFGSLRAGALRPAARPLSWGEWGLGLGLYALAIALCSAVLAAAAIPLGVNAHVLSFGSFGSRQ
jgi:Zn-dependent protease